MSWYHNLRLLGSHHAHLLKLYLIGTLVYQLSDAPQQHVVIARDLYDEAVWSHYDANDDCYFFRHSSYALLVFRLCFSASRACSDNGPNWSIASRSSRNATRWLV